MNSVEIFSGFCKILSEQKVTGPVQAVTLRKMAWDGYYQIVVVVQPKNVTPEYYSAICNSKGELTNFEKETVGGVK